MFYGLIEMFQQYSWTNIQKLNKTKVTIEKQFVSTFLSYF